MNSQRDFVNKEPINRANVTMLKSSYTRNEQGPAYCVGISLFIFIYLLHDSTNDYLAFECEKSYLSFVR